MLNILKYNIFLELDRCGHYKEDSLVLYSVPVTHYNSQLCIVITNRNHNTVSTCLLILPVLNLCNALKSFT